MRERKKYFEKHYTVSRYYAYNFKMRAAMVTTTKGESAGSDNVLNRIITGMKDDGFDDSKVSIGKKGEAR